MDAASWVPSHHVGKILLLFRLVSLVNLTITVPLSLAVGSGSIIWYHGFIFVFTTPIIFVQMLWQASIYNAAKKAPSTRWRPGTAPDSLSRYQRRNRRDTRVIEPVSPIFNMIADFLEFCFFVVWYVTGMREVVQMKDNTGNRIVLAIYACLGALIGVIIHGSFVLLETRQYTDYRRAQNPCCLHCRQSQQTTRSRGVVRRSDTGVDPSGEGLLPPAYDEEERAPLYEDVVVQG